MSLFAAGALQGSVLAWCSDHYKHHVFTDTEKDPHNVLKYNTRLKRLLWSHIGWVITRKWPYKSYQDIDKPVMARLGKNRILRWQFEHYMEIAMIMNTLVPATVGFYFGNMDLLSAYAGFLFIGLGRALEHQIIYVINSVQHEYGTRYYSKSTATDIWWLAPFLLGENWHNYHHAFPSDYRNGIKWYHMDVNKWIIYLMSKVGLAWDLKYIEDVRIKAKMQYVRALQTSQQQRR